MPQDLLTTITTFVLTVLSLITAVVAIRHRSVGRTDAGKRAERILVAICGGAAGLLFIYRCVVVHANLPPIEAHVDGLLLIAALFAGIVLFLGVRERLPGINAFALPVLTILLAWAFCSSWFTFEPFAFASAWKTVHLFGVYLGTLSVAIAAVAGAMYLVGQRRLRLKQPQSDTPLPSLERVEKVIVRTSAVGFAMLTVGVVTGVIIIGSNQSGSLTAGWWYSPKVVLGVTVWVLFALLMNVRHATVFRGARAAWLSIAGLVLILATFGAAVATPHTTHASDATGDKPLARPAEQVDAPPPPAADVTKPITSDQEVN